MRLPGISSVGENPLRWQESFGGLDERLGAGDGAITAMTNMTGDHFPVMSTRPPRRRLRTLAEPHGLGAAEALYWVDGTQFYYDGTPRGTVTAGDKRFACLGAYIVIWPDQKYYNVKTGAFGDLMASLSSQSAVVCSAASPSGLSSDANCIKLVGCVAENSFAPDEAVYISGDVDAADGRTLVIREVEGDSLYFYDNSFALDATVRYDVTEPLSAGTYWFQNSADSTNYSFTTDESITVGSYLMLEPQTVCICVYNSLGTQTGSILGQMGRETGATELAVTECFWPQTGTLAVTRDIPPLEHICQCGNRLWGAYGNTICCSYLGNPRVWYNFDQTATACWSSEVGTPGAFTAAFAYGGYPLFFKEDHILRVYGTKSASFQIFDTETLGVESGSEKSLAVVGQTLYYKSRAGFVAYAGGVPRRVDGSLGTARREIAVAGTDGRKYYVSCRANGAWSLLVYDSENGLWHREDVSHALDFGWCGGELYMLRDDGEIWMLGRVRSTEGETEGAFESECELAPMTGAAGGREAVERLYFRVSAEDTLTAEVSYDGSGVWEKLTSLGGDGRRVRTVELVPRRCMELRLRLRGRGGWQLWALGREYAAGTRMGV